MMNFMLQAIRRLVLPAASYALAAVLGSNACFAEHSSVQNFFISLDSKYLEDIDIDETTRSDIIQSEFKIGIDTCEQKGEGTDPWYISKTTSNQLELKQCSNLEKILFLIYKSTPANLIGLVVFISGNHQQTQNLDFFKISPDRKPQPTPAITLGLKPTTENEFLDYKQRFSSTDNRQVPFFIDPENGTIQASPWTWMEPRWEKKTIKWEIRYFWSGTHFEKKKIPIPPSTK